MREKIATARASDSEGLDVCEELRKIAAKVGVGMPSIQWQYDTWRTRTLYYRRYMVETQLLTSAKGRHRRLAWIVFLTGS